MSNQSSPAQQASFGYRSSRLDASPSAVIPGRFGDRSGITARAFTLIELLVVVSIVALLISMLLPALSQARRAGKLAVCKSNQHQFIVATHSYANEFKDRLWSLSWQPRELTPSLYGDLRIVPQDEAQAVALQAVDIIRRRTGRDNFPRIDGWIPTVLYNHLALQDYLAQRLPEKMVACPEDRNLLLWQTDPINYERLGGLLPPGEAGSPRWPYSSSWRMITPMWSNDRPWRTGGWILANHLGGYDRGPAHPPCIGRRNMFDVTMPSGKVMMFDMATRHFGKIPFYWNYEDSRQPFSFFDGSVRVKRTGDCNPGINPDTGSGTYTYGYSNGNGTTTLPPHRDGSYSTAPRQMTKAYFMALTIGGLGGVDYDSEEIVR